LALAILAAVSVVELLALVLKLAWRANRVCRQVSAGSASCRQPPLAAPKHFYVINGADHTVSVINPDNTVQPAAITVGYQPEGVTVSATGATADDVYVTNLGSDSVSVIDPTTNAIVNTITGFNRPWGIAVA
jgi:YVTN family beta-propeller protein